MDIDEERKFIFIRELNVGNVKFKIGDELRLYRGAVFYNDGMLSEGWSKKLRKEFLEKIMFYENWLRKVRGL